MTYLQAGVDARAAWAVLSAARLPLHPGKVLEAVPALELLLGPSRLEVFQRLGWRPSWIKRMLELQAERELKRFELAVAQGYLPLIFSDPAYPPLLRQISSPPPVLWVRGHVEALALPAVALVGSRQANAYGLDLSARLAGDLAAAGVAVVSGGALGCDAIAHRTALERLGFTVAVLGTGIDMSYPSEHERLFAQIAETGACVSEFVPGAPPRANHFPIRNRTISGLSLGVVVVQGMRKSGALITARFALEQDRDIFAVPGWVTDPQSEGPHHLIRQGALLVSSAAEVLDALAAKLPPGVHWPERGRRGAAGDSLQLSLRLGGIERAATAGGSFSPRVAAPPSMPELEPEARLVWDALVLGSASLDVLAHRTGMSTERLGALLFELELDDLVVQAPGQLFGLKPSVG